MITYREIFGEPEDERIAERELNEKENFLPQASDEMRELMGLLFGDSIELSGPLEFLRSRGYTEEKGYISYPPGREYMTVKEELAIRFLEEEWDFAFEPRREQ